MALIKETRIGYRKPWHLHSVLMVMQNTVPQFGGSSKLNTISIEPNNSIPYIRQQKPSTDKQSSTIYNIKEVKTTPVSNDG